MHLTNANSKQTFNEIFFKSEGYHMLLTNANFKQTLNEIFFDQIYANTTVGDQQWLPNTYRHPSTKLESYILQMVYVRCSFLKRLDCFKIDLFSKEKIMNPFTCINIYFVKFHSHTNTQTCF